MPWLLLLHISALLFWFGSILYLPALISSSASKRDALEPATGVVAEYSDMPRAIFTLFATPAALLAIVSGTAVFLFHGIVGIWLVAKLTLVTGLVLCHTLVALLIARAEKGHQRYLGPMCAAVGGVSALLIAGILWLVLDKPF